SVAAGVVEPKLPGELLRRVRLGREAIGDGGVGGQDGTKSGIALAGSVREEESREAGCRRCPDGRQSFSAGGDCREGNGGRGLCHGEVGSGVREAFVAVSRRGDERGGVVVQQQVKIAGAEG